MLSLDPGILILLIPILLFSLIFHEYMHARTAVFFGDDTPKIDNRLSFNPMAHLDLFGTVSLFLIGFGWAKPVRINLNNLNNPFRDDIYISLAGPFANLFLAALAILILKFVDFDSNLLYNVFWYMYQINLILAIFNVLPFYPLDGSHVVASLLNIAGKGDVAAIYQKISGYVFLALIALDLVADISIFRGLIVFISDIFKQFVGI